MKFKKYLLILFSMLPAALFFFAAATSLANYTPKETEVSTSEALPKCFEDTLENYDNIISQLNLSINELQSQNLTLETENKALKAVPKNFKISDSEDTDDAEYTDGTYTGSAKGFAGKVKVEVVINDKKIAAIKVLSHCDDDAFMSRALNLIPEILEKQSTRVDTISGATYSSKGIIRAVNKALMKAEGEDVIEEPENQVEIGKGSFPFSDGTYEGVGKGFKGNVRLAVTIKNSTITDIKVLSTNDDNSYFQKASAIIDLVLTNQTLNVDTVSGATYSSKGIKTALSDSMKSAAMKTYSLVEKSEEESKDKTQEQPSEAPITSPYTDGVYHGQSICYSQDGISFDDYAVDLTVTIKSGRITDISASTAADEYSNNWFMDALNGYNGNDGMKASLLALSDYNSIDSIDVVSGATCSSESIKVATKDALNRAKAGTNNE